jgi:hypothetical protein
MNEIDMLMYNYGFQEQVASNVEGVPYWQIFFFLRRPNLFAICNNTFSEWWDIVVNCFEGEEDAFRAPCLGVFQFCPLKDLHMSF